MNIKRVLIAGSSWQHPMYESAWREELNRRGIDVIEFHLEPKTANIISRIERKFSICGPYNSVIQNNLINVVKQTQPDVILIWLGNSVFPKTITEISKFSSAGIFCYVHDDPFAHLSHNLSPYFHKYFWRPFIKSLPYYDIVFFSKKLNINEAYRMGCKRADILQQYYVPRFHQRRTLDSSDDHYLCDVAFAGHFEPDGRDLCINSLAEEGLYVNVYADFTWKNSGLNRASKFIRILPRANGGEYPKALSGAKICLCFMSKMNRDRYTTRCFEIPACGSLLVCERTPELEEIFVDGKEAVFFSTQEELLEKVLFLLKNLSLMEEIRVAGFNRIMQSHHSIVDRVEKFLQIAS
jgi:spore maturation protein CgeB